MIIDLPSTTSSAINKKMVDVRERGGANATGRVLTLVIVTDEDSSEDPIAAANGASFEHPCRVIVVAKGNARGAARLDAQIRVGGDAGASEVIVLRLFGALAQHGASVVVPLLLADAPVVAWWPGAAPDVPAEDSIGALAQRRITDAAAVRRSISTLATRRAGYRPGDTDLTWTRLTNWRGLLAAALDQPPHERVTAVAVSGASDSASADLLAGWLALQLRCPVKRHKVDRAGTGLHSVTLTRRSGEITLIRPEGVTATLAVTNQPPRQMSLPRRNLRDCIAEELRRLDADEVYAEVLSKGLDLLTKSNGAEPTANAAGGRRAAAKTPTRTPAKAAPKAAAKAAAKTPAKAAAKTPAKTDTKSPAKADTKSPARAEATAPATAPAKTGAKTSTKTSAKSPTAAGTGTAPTRRRSATRRAAGTQPAPPVASEAPSKPTLAVSGGGDPAGGSGGAPMTAAQMSAAQMPAPQVPAAQAPKEQVSKEKVSEEQRTSPARAPRRRAAQESAVR